MASGVSRTLTLLGDFTAPAGTRGFLHLPTVEGVCIGVILAFSVRWQPAAITTRGENSKRGT